MKSKKLWTKLFSKKKKEDEIELAFAGAMVIHRNPFEQLEAFRNTDELTSEFANKWISPFYLSLHAYSKPEDISSFVTATNNLNIDDIKQLLGYFDWRSKLVGAYFAACKNYQQLEDIIGIHLLKSEVCYAGTGYCIALAIFGTDKSKDYLKRYLTYYLSRNDLWFDQADAFCALEYLDKPESEKFLELWNEFIIDKNNWDLDRSRSQFQSRIESILNIQKSITQA